MPDQGGDDDRLHPVDVHDLAEDRAVSRVSGGGGEDRTLEVPAGNRLRIGEIGK